MNRCKIMQILINEETCKDVTTISKEKNEPQIYGILK